jgi:hypothetical protein
MGKTLYLVENPTVFFESFLPLFNLFQNYAKINQIYWRGSKEAILEKILTSSEFI